MNEQIHQKILVVEAALLALPISLLWVVLADSTLAHITWRGLDWRLVTTLFLSAMSLAAGWYLMIRYWAHGAAGLVKAHRFIWWAAWGGVSGAFLVLIFLIVANLLLIEASSIQGFNLLVFGLPLLVPLHHLRCIRTHSAIAHEP